MSVLPPIVFAINGSSLSTGYLSADWVPTLLADLKKYPEAKGPIFVNNMGHGGWTSADMLGNAPNISVLKPTHVLTEGGAINDCVDFGSGPTISRAQHITNIQGMIAEWRANAPNADITLQTMSPVSAIVSTIRPQLATYYADEVATAAAQSVRCLDNYSGWPTPLDPSKSHGAYPFSIAVTATYAGLAEGAILNSGDKAATVNLSPDFLTAVSNSTTPTNGAVRGNQALSGKVHIEFIVGPLSTTSPTIYPAVGLANAAADLTVALGSDGNSICLQPNGHVIRNGSDLGSMGFTFAAGDTVGIEIDVSGALAYFMKGGVRSSGVNIAGISGSLYPAIGVYDIGTAITAHMTINGDGLHPIWAGAVNTYLYPNVLAYCRARMAAWWP